MKWCNNVAVHPVQPCTNLQLKSCWSIVSTIADKIYRLRFFCVWCVSVMGAIFVWRGCFFVTRGCLCEGCLCEGCKGRVRRSVFVWRVCGGVGVKDAWGCKGRVWRSVFVWRVCERMNYFGRFCLQNKLRL